MTRKGTRAYEESDLGQTRSIATVGGKVGLSLKRTLAIHDLPETVLATVPCFERDVEFRVAGDTAIGRQSGSEHQRGSEIASGVAVGFGVPSLQHAPYKGAVK